MDETRAKDIKLLLSKFYISKTMGPNKIHSTILKYFEMKVLSTQWVNWEIYRIWNDYLYLEKSNYNITT